MAAGRRPVLFADRPTDLCLCRSSLSSFAKITCGSFQVVSLVPPVGCPAGTFPCDRDILNRSLASSREITRPSSLQPLASRGIPSPAGMSPLLCCWAQCRRDRQGNGIYRLKLTAVSTCSSPVCDGYFPGLLLGAFLVWMKTFSTYLKGFFVIFIAFNLLVFICIEQWFVL